LNQLRALKKEHEELKKDKIRENRKMQEFIQNCKKLIMIQSQERQDYILENLIQFEESFKNIAMNISGFKNIRNRLFNAANKPGENKLFLYVFHLFESVIADVSSFCSKAGDFAFSQLSENTMQAARRRLKKKRSRPEGEKKKTPGTSCNVSFNGENMKSVDVTVSQDADGFFNENIKSILESKRTINDIINQIQKEQESKAQEYITRKEQLKDFLEELK